MNDDIKIEKGIPVPAPRKKYPFIEMEIGDSVLIKGVTQKQVSGITSYYRTKKGMGFTTRTREGGIRVWRIL